MSLKPPRCAEHHSTVRMVLHFNLQSSRTTRPRGLQSKSSKNKPHPCKTAAMTISGVPAPQHPPSPAEASPASPAEASRAGHKKAHQNHAKPCNTMQNQAKSCHAKIKQCEKIVQNELFLRSVHTCTPCSNSSFQRKTVRNKLPTICTDPESARPGKKNWPRKKRMASWARQRQQITEAADGGARACTGADGAVVPGGQRAALARGRAANPGGPALLLPPSPTWACVSTSVLEFL